MQDIVFYAAANETLGIVRDYANARNQSAPVLVLGVSACLRIRLFAACEVAAPYPIAAFSGIIDWQWNMDTDFDRSTTCKLTADAGDISVHSVTDTVNGETLNFTEFVIPISNMNTQELAAWLGSEKKRSGLNGELVGYDSAGNAAFVLQIENFTVRNRVAGLGEPTALDQGIVTRSLAEQMIQTAVSSSAAVKQDKLTSANAGTGISITSNGVISTANVPQSAITGLSASLAAKQDNLAAGDLIEISSMTVNRKRYMNIIENANILTRTITPTGSTASVQALVLEPGNAYRINAVSSAKWLATTATFKDSTGTWGIEGHVVLFVAGTGYVRTDSNIVLANALEPDAVNNCTVRFHDGLAIISVEDHVAGYIVVSATGTSSGSLYYGLATSTNEYIAVDASLNGQTLDLGGVTTYAGEKHVVGNGYTETILSGGITCTSKTTFSNLSMDGVVNSGGTMTLGDVNIPSGATVSVNGGGLAVEKVVGSGTVDLGGTNIYATSNTIARGCTFTSGSATVATVGGGAFVVVSGRTLTLEDCVVSSNSAIHAGGILVSRGVAYFSNTIISGNTANQGADLAVNGGQANIVGCTIGKAATGNDGVLVFEGTNTIDVFGKFYTGSGSAVISSGASINLTSSIAPGGGVTFKEGGAMIIPGGSSTLAYTLGGMTVPQIGNTNVINLAGYDTIRISSGSATMSDVIVTGAVSDANGGAFNLSNSGTVLTANRCIVSGNTSPSGGGFYIGGKTTVVLNGSTVNGNSANDIRLGNSASLEINDSVVGSVAGNSNTVIRMGGSNRIGLLDAINTPGASVLISSGAVVDLTGNTNSFPIMRFPGGIVLPARPSGQDVKIKYTSGGGSDFNTFTELEIRGTTITNQGIIYGATVTIPADTPETWLLFTTESESTIELTSANAGDYVVTGGLKGIDML